MSNGKTVAEFGGHIFGQQGNGNAGSVAGDYAIRVNGLVQSRVKVAFQIQPFHDGFYHPIAIGKAVEIVVYIADGDVIGAGFIHQSGRVGFQ